MATTAGLYLLLNTPTSKKTHLRSFMDHKRKYNKVHTTKDDLEYRFSIYADNMQYIEEHNSKGKSFTLGENQFTDMTFEEFSQKYLTQPIANTLKFAHYGEVPQGEVDWEKQGKVTRVKNQAACGSCWAFSAIGSLEAAYSIYQDKSIELSEQELVDCSSEYGNNGCNGGIMSNAFEYIIERQISTENDYVYTAHDDSCKADQYTEKYTVESYNVIEPVNVEGLAGALDKQPVSVAIEVRKDFMHYSEGIYTSDSSCGMALNHGVLAVGYKNVDGENYFKVKNSWGTAWGEEGYIRMAIGEGSGTCGIANEAAVYPLLK